MSEQPAPDSGDPRQGAFDKAEVMENFAGDAELFAQVTEIFLDDIPLQLAALDVAEAEGDLVALRAAAHKIKGSVASFAAHAAQAASKALEDACKVGDAGKVPALAAAVRSQTRHLIAALRAELAN